MVGAILAALLALLTSPAPAAAQELTLSAAISLREAVEEVGRSFGPARPGVRLRYNLGSSGQLQRQIEAGAPVDLFLSAGAPPMDELERRGLILPDSRRAFARNVLAVVTPARPAVDLARPGDLLDARVSRVVIGDPRTVPAGQYAQESLRALGLWERLQPKLVLAENVRQVLDYVSRGEAEAGFVYATDAAVRAGSVKEAFRPPQDTYRPVVYPAAVVKASRQPALARAFVERLLSREGQAVLARLGFQPAPAGAR